MRALDVDELDGRPRSNRNDGDAKGCQDGKGGGQTSDRVEKKKRADVLDGADSEEKATDKVVSEERKRRDDRPPGEF